VSASPQCFCSSDGTVILIHGFPPLGLASNHRGWEIHTHSIFTRRPQGEPAAISICQSPDRDRLKAVFCLGICGTDKTIRLTRGRTAFGPFVKRAPRGQMARLSFRISLAAHWLRFRERFMAQWLGFVSAWRCRARGTPSEEPAPLRRGSVSGPGRPHAGAVFARNRRRIRPRVGCKASCSHQSRRALGRSPLIILGRHCCSKSSVRFRFSERREILLTVRSDMSFCSIRECLKDICDD
jgi:hypothetical protein